MHGDEKNGERRINIQPLMGLSDKNAVYPLSVYIFVSSNFGVTQTVFFNSVCKALFIDWPNL